jgi:hypothetical protein
VVVVAVQPAADLAECRRLPTTMMEDEAAAAASAAVVAAGLVAARAVTV